MVQVNTTETPFSLLLLSSLPVALPVPLLPEFTLPTYMPSSARYVLRSIITNATVDSEPFIVKTENDKTPVGKISDVPEEILIGQNITIEWVPILNNKASLFLWCLEEESGFVIQSITTLVQSPYTWNVRVEHAHSLCFFEAIFKKAGFGIITSYSNRFNLVDPNNPQTQSNNDLTWIAPSYLKTKEIIQGDAFLFEWDASSSSLSTIEVWNSQGTKVATLAPTITNSVLWESVDVPTNETYSAHLITFGNIFASPSFQVIPFISQIQFLFPNKQIEWFVGSNATINLLFEENVGLFDIFLESEISLELGKGAEVERFQKSFIYGFALVVPSVESGNYRIIVRKGEERIGRSDMFRITNAEDMPLTSDDDGSVAFTEPKSGNVYCKGAKLQAELAFLVKRFPEVVNVLLYETRPTRFAKVVEMNYPATKKNVGIELGQIGFYQIKVSGWSDVFKGWSGEFQVKECK